MRTPPTGGTSALATRLLLVGFRSGEAVAHHPELADWLRRGWRVLKAKPRLTEEGAKLFVVLGRPTVLPPPTPAAPALRNVPTAAARLATPPLPSPPASPVGHGSTLR